MNDLCLLALYISGLLDSFGALVDHELLVPHGTLLAIGLLVVAGALPKGWFAEALRYATTAWFTFVFWHTITRRITLPKGYTR